jgi:pilus assembly protein Flp/PilA
MLETAGLDRRCRPESGARAGTVEAGGEATRGVGGGAVEGRRVFRSAGRFVRDASGASALEYGLVVGLVALALIAGMGFAGNVMENIYTYIANTLQNILVGS